MAGGVNMSNIYSRWLGLPEHLCPPTYYQLLSVSPSELNPTQIQEAAEAQLQGLLEHLEGPEAQQCRQLVDEVIKARDTLLDPIARQRYDQLIPHPAESWWNTGKTSTENLSSPAGELWWQQSVEAPPV